MSEPTRVTLPADREQLASLVCGEEVLLSGVLFTARDEAHRRIAEELAREGRLPHGLEGQALFYAGPTPPTPGRPAGSIGPTTSKRMDPYTPSLLRAGIVAVVGKGARSEAVREAFAETGAVYFAAVGGSAALLGSSVTAAEPVAYADLGTEALVRLEVRDLPVFVAIDATGRDLYAEAAAEWREA